MDKLLKKFPFNSDMLQAVRLLNPNNRLLLTERHVLRVAEKVLPDSTDDQLDNLLDEWKIYQAASDIPDFKGQDIDLWWAQVLARKDYVQNNSCVFAEISKLIKILLVLPYNQAPVERVFSMIGKIDTKFRPTISLESVCSLLTCKLNCSSECYAIDVSQDLFKSAKTATNRYNTELKENKS